jgi:hypothetical protein
MRAFPLLAAAVVALLLPLPTVPAATPSPPSWETAFEGSGDEEAAHVVRWTPEGPVVVPTTIGGAKDFLRAIAGPAPETTSTGDVGHGVGSMQPAVREALGWTPCHGVFLYALQPGPPFGNLAWRQAVPSSVPLPPPEPVCGHPATRWLEVTWDNREHAHMAWHCAHPQAWLDPAAPSGWRCVSSGVATVRGTGALYSVWWGFHYALDAFVGGDATVDLGTDGICTYCEVGARAAPVPPGGV